MYKVGVFHNFSEEEAFLVVVMGAPTGFVHIGHGIEAGASTAGCVNSLEPVPDPVTVLMSVSMSSAMGEKVNSPFRFL